MTTPQSPSVKPGAMALRLNGAPITVEAIAGLTDLGVVILDPPPPLPTPIDVDNLPRWIGPDGKPEGSEP